MKVKFFKKFKWKMAIPSSVPNLKQFMLKRKVIQLYREFFRVTKQIQDVSQRKEVRDWIRTDFKNNKNTNSEYAIKLLIQSGERSLRELQSNMAMAK